MLLCLFFLLFNKVVIYIPYIARQMLSCSNNISLKPFIFCQLAIFVFLIGCSSMLPIDITTINPEQPRMERPTAQWFSCQADSDCTLIQNKTCSLSPVNSDYAQQLTLWEQNRSEKHRTDKHKSCSNRPTSHKFGYLPVCELETCATKRVPSQPSE